MSDRERKKNEFDATKVAAISLARLADAADQAVLSIDAPSSQNVWLRAFFHASGGDVVGTKADIESAASFADDVLASFQKRFPEEKDEEPLEGRDPREDDDDDG